MTFPGHDWSVTTPDEVGVDPARLKSAVDYLTIAFRDYGDTETLMIVRGGYVIWKGADIEKGFHIFSAGKSFTSTVLGLLIDDGKTSLNALAKKYVPGLAEQYPSVTLRHFATMTSGYDAVWSDYELDSQHRGDSWNPGPPAPPLFAPGTKFRYWDEAMMQFGEVITAIAGQPVDDLFQRRIGEVIGMRDWYWMQHDSRVGRILLWTGGVHVSSEQLARFGLLFLNRGNWDGRQLISSSWVDQASSVQVPVSVPNDDLPRSRGSGIYGYNWWVNGIKPNGQRLWPGAPPRTYYASGLHVNVCIVVPEWNMVITRTNGPCNDGSANYPANVDEIWSGFFERLATAIDP
jgi:CubicO group peptidase (beta-lactamase class C family)